MNGEDSFKKQIKKFENNLNAKYDDLKEELKFKTTILNNTDSIFVYDINGNFVYINETACKFLDYTKEELNKINFYDLNVPELSQLIRPQMKEIVKKNELIFQSAYLRKDKSVVDVEIHAKLIEFKEEKLIICVFHDITELKKTEKKLTSLAAIKEREERLSLVTNNMLDLIYQVNSKGIFEYVSPSIKELLGYEVEDIIGMRDFELISIIHPDDFEILIDTLQAAIVTLKPKRVQHRYRHADGHYIWVETIGNPLSDDNGEFSGAVYITRDITELKNIENKLKSSLEEKEVLLREIHHRVKNNMQIISSLLNLQSRHLTDEKTVNVLKESRNRVKSMAMVHEELYRSNDLSKIDFAEYIQRLLSGLFSSYGVDQNYIKPKINVGNILLDIGNAVPCGLIINELVSNSLKHAFKHGKKGIISTKFYLNGSKHVLIVADDGTGFPEDIDFKNTKTLGLQLVNTLVKQLHGSINISRNNGTLFKIIF